MQWSELKDLQQLEVIAEESAEKKILIFKHSTRCSISSAALDRLQRNWNNAEMIEVKPYFLDLIRYRDISNAVETKWNIQHESPQVLMLSNGKAIFHQSHFGITYDAIRSAIKN